MKPLFVIGHPKSGTSLMNSLLDNHPDLVTLSEESDFYLTIWPKAKLLNSKLFLSREERLDKMYGEILTLTHFNNYLRGKVDRDISGNLDYDDFPKEKFLSALKSGIADSMSNGLFSRRELMVSIVEAYGNSVIGNNWDKRKYWVEKTPKHTWHLNEIQEDFEDASFLFVHRDPRDNFVSFKKKVGSSLTIPKFCKTWNTAIEQYDRIPKSFAKSMICYESLIENQSVELERIVAFLGISLEASLFTPTKLGKTWKGNSMFDLTSSELHNKSIGRFENYLSEEDLCAIEFFTAENMIRLGYDLKTDGSGKNVQLIDELKREYTDYFPFNKGEPLSIRSKLGLFRRRFLD